MGTARLRKPSIRALQNAVRVTADNEWGPQTDKACSIVNHASSGQFPFGLKATQKTVGVSQDGVWGPETRAATWLTVIHVQKALTLMGFDTQGLDGIWGPKTQAAFYAARDSHHPYEPPKEPDD